MNSEEQIIKIARDRKNNDFFCLATTAGPPQVLVWSSQQGKGYVLKHYNEPTTMSIFYLIQNASIGYVTTPFL